MKASFKSSSIDICNTCIWFVKKKKALIISIPFYSLLKGGSNGRFRTMWAKIVRLCFLRFWITVWLWVGLRNEIMNGFFFKYFAFLVAKKKGINGTVFIDFTFDCVLKILWILQQQKSIRILNVACSIMWTRKQKRSCVSLIICQCIDVIS